MSDHDQLWGRLWVQLRGPAVLSVTAAAPITSRDDAEKEGFYKASASPQGWSFVYSAVWASSMLTHGHKRQDGCFWCSCGLATFLGWGG